MAGTPGFGSKLKMHDGQTPGTFADIPHVGDFQSPEQGPSTHNVTTHSSPGGYVEKMPGIRDGGTFTVAINWHPDNAVHQQLRALANTDDIRLFQVWEPTETEGQQFPAFVRFNTSHPVDGPMVLNVTFEVAGLVETIGDSDDDDS